MRVHLIFYRQNDTEVSQKIVSGVLARFGLLLDGTDYTYNINDFSYVLGESVKNDELIFVVGGLDISGTDNITRILSSALSVPIEEAGRSRAKYILDKAHGMPQPTLMGSDILYNRMNGPDGFAITSGIQCIMCLPDVQAQLSDMLAGSGAAYFARLYGLTEMEMLSRQMDDPLVEIRPGELTSILDTTLNLSQIGRNFNEKISEAAVKVHAHKKTGIGNILIRVAIVIAVISIIFSVFIVGYESFTRNNSDYKAQQIYKETKQLYNQSGSSENLPENVLEKYSLLYEENSDIGGWFSVPGTELAYPVMIAPENESTYYSTHDFKKNESAYGALYFDKNYGADIYDVNENTVIYGNSLSNGGMLAELENYTQKEYFTNHPLIQFDTLYTEQMWRVFSVAIVSSNTISEFNYADNSFYGDYAKEEHLYELFIRSMFYTAVDVFPTDNLLTIITPCDEFEGARLIVCARAVRDDEDLSDMYEGVVENPFVLMPDIWYSMSGESRPSVPEFEYAQEIAETTTTTTIITAKTTTTTSTTAQKTTTKTKKTESKQTETKTQTQTTKTSKTSQTTAATTTKATTTTTTKTTASNGEDKQISAKQGLTMRITSNGKIMEGAAEDILAKIIEAEMGGGYNTEALKAQAVAAYTYYLYSGGAAKAPSFPTKSSPSQKCKDAAKAVVGIKMLYNGKAPYACYTAISAGRTANNTDVNVSSLPYLVAVDCSVDENVKGFETVKTYSASDVKAKIKKSFGIDLSGIDKSSWFKVTKRNADDLYVLNVQIGNTTISGTKFWKKMRYNYVRSTAFWITYNADADTFTFRSRGYGHCVGLSQKGANEYAKQGKSYQWILKHFYTGVTITS